MIKKLATMKVCPPKNVSFLPVTEKSRPLSGAKWLATPIDLSSFGYIEKEYLVSGRANVYSWPMNEETPLIINENGKYCTRILVRMPADPSKFSGFVAMESFNGSFTIDHQSGGWGLTHEYLIQSGDGWVGYTKDYACIQSLIKFDPKRYSGIGFPNPKPISERGEAGWDPFLEYCRRNNAEFPLILDSEYERGLTYDAAFQIAALIKSDNINNPFFGYNVRKVIGFGINDYNTYISALHKYMRLENNKPVFDGYLMYMSGEGGALNYEEDMFPLDSERCKLGCDVPIIRIETAGDLRGFLPHPLWAALWRCEDSDEFGNQMRWYEIPGLGVAAAFRQDESAFACDEDYEKIGSRNKAKDRKYEYWNQMCLHIMTGAYSNLKSWINGIDKPPKCDKIGLTGNYPCFEFINDRFGNHTGGIRHTYLEVPIARFGDDSSITFFEKEQRDALYKDKTDYLEKVRKDAERMVKERWILPSAVDMIVKQAEEIQW